MQPHRQQPTRISSSWDSPGTNTRVGCHFLLQCMKVKSENEVAQSCPTLCDPMDCSLPGSSIHGIFQVRVLERGAIASSKGRLPLMKFQKHKSSISDHISSVYFSSVAQSCLTLCDPMNRITPGLPVITNSWRSLTLTSIESAMPSSHLILCPPLLLLPPNPSQHQSLFQ